MKAIVNKLQKGNTALPYPKLMISTSNRIVLFQNRKEGVLISQENGGMIIGSYSRDWCDEHFIDFDGEVCMGN